MHTPATATATHCPYCALQCGMNLRPAPDGAGVAVEERTEFPVNRGALCGKGRTAPAVLSSRVRLTEPLVRTRAGRLEPATWEEALDAVAEGLARTRDAHGPDAVGVFGGGGLTNEKAYALGKFARVALRTSQIDYNGRFCMSSAAAAHQRAFGLDRGLPFPLEDIPRTGCVILVGSNPAETMPPALRYFTELKANGGTLIVVDPRRTRTARLADRHLAPRPGSDALLLAALARTLLAEHRPTLPQELADRLHGLRELRDALARFTPEAVAPACDIPAAEIRDLARDLAAAPTAAVYGRIGSCTVEFGTLASWLVDVLNILTGNLDRPGGALFPLPAAGPRPRPAGPGKGFALGRWHSRVGGHPEAKSELPLAALAEEIETPGEGRIRGLVAIAANPVLSAPDGQRLDAALAGLDFMVSVDPYLNETSRHAHVVLPPPPPAQSAHHDFAFNGFAVRNQVRYTRPAVPLQEGLLDECEIHARLVLAAAGLHGPAVPDAAAAVDDPVIRAVLAKETADPDSPLHGQDPGRLAGLLTGDSGPERRLDLMLRLGPYGDLFGTGPDTRAGGGLTLARLLDRPHGIDLGPLQPRLPGVLKTRSGRIELLPDPIAAELPRLRSALAARPAALVLVGRRHLRSNNSWMHNVQALIGGSNRCTLHVHPQDAERLGLTDGGRARITADGGSLEVPVEVTDTVRAGVVSPPHGWGHDRAGARLSVAAASPGANVNQLLDGSRLDPLSGTAVLNGFPVELAPLP